jgi:hypothetical protein
MAKSAKIERSQKLFLKAMREKFKEDPSATSTVFPGTIIERSRAPPIPGTLDNKRIKVHVTLIPDKEPINDERI